MKRKGNLKEESPEISKVRKPLKRILQWVFVALVFFYLGRMVWENWGEVEKAHFSLRLFPFLAATLIFGSSYFIQVYGWYLITRKLRIAISFRETVSSWFYSQMGKYLPGKIWLVLSRFYLYRERGCPGETVTVALYFETVGMVLASGLVFLLSLVPFGEGPSFPVRISPSGAALFCLSGIFLLHPRALEWTLNKALKVLKREPLRVPLTYFELAQILAVFLLSWGVGGLGFFLLVDSVIPVSPNVVPFLTGALAVSNTLGLFALFAPGGLGVREGVLVYCLTSLVPGSVAVVLSVLTRLWMTFIEIALIGVVYLENSIRHSKGRRPFHG